MRNANTSNTSSRSLFLTLSDEWLNFRFIFWFFKITIPSTFFLYFLFFPQITCALRILAMAIAQTRCDGTPSSCVVTVMVWIERKPCRQWKPHRQYVRNSGTQAERVNCLTCFHPVSFLYRDAEIPFVSLFTAVHYCSCFVGFCYFFIFFSLSPGAAHTVNGSQHLRRACTRQQWHYVKCKSNKKRKAF